MVVVNAIQYGISRKKAIQAEPEKAEKPEKAEGKKKATKE